MDELDFQNLLEKYAVGDCNLEELTLLESWYLSKSRENDNSALLNRTLLAQHRKIWENISSQTGIETKVPLRKRIGFMIPLTVAASIILVYFLSGHCTFSKRPNQKIAMVKSANHDLLPGKNKAVLILSNGKKINLTSANNGIIATDDNAIIHKNKNGSIIYQGKTGAITDQKMVYNTVKTERGEQWPNLELPDGTKVMLDAASSITYPLYFSNNERRVTVTGQVYFQVFHNSSKPFRVVANSQIIEDMGTAFNVNAYNDEPNVKTTLVQGSVRISTPSQNITLKPGQQAITTFDNENISVKNVNIDGAVDWKNGLFHFNHEDLKSAMRQIARWYNVDVVYEGNLPKADINGEVYRNMNAAKVFEVLNNLKVNLKIEGNKIIVTDKKI